MALLWHLQPSGTIREAPCPGKCCPCHHAQHLFHQLHAPGDVPSNSEVAYLLEYCTNCGMTSKPLGKLAAFLVALPKKAMACGERTFRASSIVEFLGVKH